MHFRQAIELNFKGSIIIFVVSEVVLFGLIAPRFPETLGTVNPLANQTLIMTVLLPTLFILSWAFYYKNKEGHRIALGFGILILGYFIASQVSEAVNEIEYSAQQWVYCYVGISHILYSLLNLGESIGQRV